MKQFSILTGVLILAGMGTIALAQSSQNLAPAADHWNFSVWGTATGTGATLQNGFTINSGASGQMRNVRMRARMIPLVNGRYYHLHFQAAASVPANMEVLVSGTDDLTAACFDQTIPLQSGWRDVDLDFQASNAQAGRGVIYMYFGDTVGQYAVQNVSLVEVVPPKAAGPKAAAGGGTAGGSGETGGLPTGWMVEVSGKAQAGQIYSIDGPIIDVDRIDGDPSNVQFAQELVDIKEGNTYSLHFRARSPISPVIGVVVQDLATGHANLGLDKTVALTPQWQEFTLSFKARKTISGKGRVALVLGGLIGTVQVADVKFGGVAAAPAAVPPSAMNAAAPPATQAPAGALKPVAAWDLTTLGSAVANMTPSAGGAVVQIDRADGNPSHIVLKQDGVSLEDGKSYSLMFKAKSSVSRQVPVVASVDDGSSHLVGLNDHLRMTPEWQDYTIKFTAVQPQPEHSRIAFLLGGAAGTVELSDIVLSPNGEGAPSAASAPVQTARMP